MTSEELWRLCKRNDPEAWTYAYNYVIQFLRIKKIPEFQLMDVAHDTISYFMRKGEQAVSEGGAFKYLLRTKAWSLVIDNWRKNKWLVPTIVGDEVDGESRHGRIIPDHSRIMEGIFVQDALRVVDECLNVMGEQCRVILKRYFQAKALGEKLEKVAKELGHKVGWLRTNVHRCHKKLTKMPAYQALLKEMG